MGCTSGFRLWAKLARPWVWSVTTKVRNSFLVGQQNAPNGPTRPMTYNSPVHRSKPKAQAQAQSFIQLLIP